MDARPSETVNAYLVQPRMLREGEVSSLLGSLFRVSEICTAPRFAYVPPQKRKHYFSSEMSALYNTIRSLRFLLVANQPGKHTYF